MPGPTTVVRGNVSLEMLLIVTLTPPNVGANTTAEGSYTVGGLLPNDFIEINQLSHIVGLSIGNVRVISPNTVNIQFVNSTAVAINGSPPTQYIFNVDRAENASLGQASFPSQVV
jgi:hypothetical protein